MLATGRSWAARVACGRHTLRAVDAVIPKECAEVREVRFKRVEERKRFCGIDKIEVATKADGVTIEGARNIVDQFKARLAVEVRVAAIDSRCERVRELQVRLGRDGREIK